MQKAQSIFFLPTKMGGGGITCSQAFFHIKKVFIIIALAAFFILAAEAQSNYQTVYLKNGSIIKGQIIEEVPGKSVKLRSKDGSLFVYNTDEVERITHETERRKSGKADTAGWTSALISR